MSATPMRPFGKIDHGQALPLTVSAKLVANAVKVFRHRGRETFMMWMGRAGRGRTEGVLRSLIESKSWFHREPDAPAASGAHRLRLRNPETPARHARLIEPEKSLKGPIPGIFPVSNPLIW